MVRSLADRTFQLRFSATEAAYRALQPECNRFRKALEDRKARTAAREERGLEAALEALTGLRKAVYSFVFQPATKVAPSRRRAWGNQTDFSDKPLDGYYAMLLVPQVREAHFKGGWRPSKEEAEASAPGEGENAEECEA